MTLAVRVIPCLDVDAGRVVKGVNFRELRDAGDPVEMAGSTTPRAPTSWSSSTSPPRSGSRETMYDVVRRTAEQVFIPLTVGGGVRALDDVDRLLRAGRRQGRRQHRRHRAARAARARSPSGSATRCWCSPSTRGARRATTERLRGHHARRAAAAPASTRWSGRSAREELGVGRDAAQLHGRRRHAGRLRPGADPRGARPRSSVPVIASGGAGRVEDFAPAVEAGADAVLAASVFHFGAAAHRAGQGRAAGSRPPGPADRGESRWCTWCPYQETA